MKKVNLIISKTLALLLVILILVGSFTGCSNNQDETNSSGNGSTAISSQTSDSNSQQAEENSVPKYIFLFIGDGMSFPQVTALGYYNGTVANDFVGTLEDPTPENEPEAEMPSFTEFPVVGAVTTYDASKFVTDSASAATAIASGVKTLDGMLGLDPYNNYVTPISETLKTELGYNIGIVTTVSLDHATPAGFYAHVASREDYYDIALQLVDSDIVDFIGGGGFKKPNGSNNDQDNIIDLAIEAGWNVVNTYEEIDALDSSAGKTMAINPELDNAAAINYEIDRDEDDYDLAKYVEKAIDVLGDEEPFFVMTEGGKIDWACHANDAMTAIDDTKDLEAAVNVAIEFYNNHPDETLILVTGDHETGGFTMGYGGTGYDTYLSLLDNQTISFNQFAKQYVAGYRENGTSFEDAMADVKELFGLILPTDEDAANSENSSLVLTEDEVDTLRTAYEVSMIPYDERELDLTYQTEYSYYDNEPFQIKITHILNNRAGLGWTTTAHTGLPVAMYAMGVGQDEFGDFYDNTDINSKIKALVELD